MNTLVQVPPAKSVVNTRFRVDFVPWTLDLLLSNMQFSSIFDSLVRYVLTLSNCSQLNKDNGKDNTKETLTFLNDPSHQTQTKHELPEQV